MLVSVALVPLLTACTGNPPPDLPPDEVVPVAAEEVGTKIPTATYTWDPTLGDPSVSAELGGPGFTGDGWQTNLDMSVLGNPDAPQGGSMVDALPDWPATLRIMGKDWNQTFNYFAFPLLYMPLLDLDPVTLKLVPALATHWQISEDRSTYRFRINPAAKWSDGTPFTAADVVATLKLRMDPTLLDPSNIQTFSKLEAPVAVSKYIVEVTAKEDNWRNFLYFANATQLPAHQIGTLTGAEYLERYQFSYTAVTGPYEVKPENIDMGNSVTVTRRADWWDDANPVYDGKFNIGSFKYVVVKDPNLRFEKVKKGEIDFFWVNKSQWWAEEVPEVDAVKRGLLVPRKFYTNNPVGTQGLALNTQRPPLDDVRVRKALQYLYDRETLIGKLFFDEYEPLVSYYQGGAYQSPDNELLLYDEISAVELLEEAGFTEVNDDGYRVKDGKELSFTLSYRSANSERYLTVFQEAAKRAGIRFEMQLLTNATHWKNVRQKQFDIASMAWGSLVFPNPELQWHSNLADQKDNNNITGYANPRVDELCKAYDEEYDVDRRTEIIREIDSLVYNDHPYVLEWYGPSQRMLFWNKFGMPEPWATGRFDSHSGDRILVHYWWVDPELETQLTAAKADDTLTMDAGVREVRFWQQWSQAQMAKSADANAGGGSEE